jgi:hypothetical protein
MPIVNYPKLSPFRQGCAECLIAQCNTSYAAEELGVRMPLGWVWSCRELGNKVVQDFAECPIRELGYFQRSIVIPKEKTNGVISLMVMAVVC